MIIIPSLFYTNPYAKAVTSGNMLFLKGNCQGLITFPVLVFASFDVQPTFWQNKDNFLRLAAQLQGTSFLVW